MVIEEVPAKWEERSVGKSNFKILNWLNEYLRWYIYGLKTSWLKKKILLIYLMNKTYLITGGTGFIGSNIAKSLVANGQKLLYLTIIIEVQLKKSKLLEEKLNLLRVT